MPQLKTICADEAEILAVAVVRYIASGAMTSGAACWDAAFDHADTYLGHHEGSAFVGAMAGLMRAIRIERSVTWRFLPANCCCLTEDEVNLVALIAAARSGRFEETQSLARLITSTVHPERLMESAHLAAAAMEIAHLRLALPSENAASAGTLH